MKQGPCDRLTTIIGLLQKHPFGVVCITNGSPWIMGANQYHPAAPENDDRMGRTSGAFDAPAMNRLPLMPAKQPATGRGKKDRLIWLSSMVESGFAERRENAGPLLPQRRASDYVPFDTYRDTAPCLRVTPCGINTWCVPWSCSFDRGCQSRHAAGRGNTNPFR